MLCSFQMIYAIRFSWALSATICQAVALTPQRPGKGSGHPCVPGLYTRKAGVKVHYFL